MKKTHTDYLVGIDIGTSCCKAVLVDAAGRVRHTESRGYPLMQLRPGWTEQNPEQWWQGAAAACRALLDNAQVDPASVRGVGLSGQMHSLVALDDRMQVIRPAILWNDQRTQKQCGQIQAAAGGLDGLLGFTNNRMLTGYTGGKILWLQEEEPEHFGRMKHMLIAKDYIRFCLTGVLATDVSDASGTGLYDVRNRDWAWELIRRLGFERTLFPPVAESSQQTGSITKEAALATGLAAGTPVFGGGGDAVLSLIGSGIVGPESAGVTLGTSGVVAMYLDSCIPNPEGKLQVFCNVCGPSWVAIGCTLAAAGSYQWFARTLGIDESAPEGQKRSIYRYLDRMAAKTPAGSGGLTFFPYLMGERCPLFDAGARGAFLGIDATMDKGYFARAVLEGVAFSLKQVYDLIQDTGRRPAKDLIISGGGAKSELWQQIVADVFGLPVKSTYGSREGSAFGAALVAGVGAGVWNTAQEAARANEALTHFLPDPQRQECYRAAYQSYCRMQRAVIQHEPV